MRRMPAEWEPHAATLMAWPTRRSLWGPTWEAAQAEYAGVANAIAAYEPVLIVVTPELATAARRRLTRGVELLEAPLDDSWLRDSGPIVVLDGPGERVGVHFTFNSWGGKYLPYDRDAAVAGPILEHLGIPRERSEMVLEGGALTVDGEGTLITTEQCLLHPNRNPRLSREQIEAELRARLGVETIIWLPYGQADDQDTDGHVDGVATYVRPGVVLAQTAPDPAHPDHERMRANLEVLRGARDARGRALEVLELPGYSSAVVDGTELSVPYLNVTIVNGAVIVPLGLHAADDVALDVIAAAFPDRDVVGVPANVIAYGGGGPHCMTQQVPQA
jgi:agmatine deiminase